MIIMRQGQNHIEMQMLGSLINPTASEIACALNHP